jgi:hypothetical protein
VWVPNIVSPHATWAFVEEAAVSHALLDGRTADRRSQSGAATASGADGRIKIADLPLKEDAGVEAAVTGDDRNHSRAAGQPRGDNTRGGPRGWCGAIDLPTDPVAVAR